MVLLRIDRASWTLTNLRVSCSAGSPVSPRVVYTVVGRYDKTERLNRVLQLAGLRAGEVCGVEGYYKRRLLMARW